MNQTLSYYAEHAEDFAAGTVAVNFSAMADRFLAYLPDGARILDFGCGSGRDSRYFLEKGYDVEAIDGSPELCRLASEYTGIPVKCMLFGELSDMNRYDGIWACASILHLPKAELPDVFARMIRAMKPGGFLYVSFKYGDFEGDRHGRYFTCLTEESFGELIGEFGELTLQDTWVTGDARPGREQELWLNAVLKRTEPSERRNIMNEDMVYEIYQANRRKYIGRLALRILMVAAALVLLLWLGCSLAAYWRGFTFIFNTSYGWDAVWSSLIIYAVIGWHILLASVAVLIIGGSYFHRTRGEYSKEAEILCTKRFARKAIPVVIVLAVVFAAFTGVWEYLTTTYSGAKIMAKYGMEDRCYNVAPASDRIFLDETYFVLKNDELIYCRGEGDEPVSVDFLDDLYYSEYVDDDWKNDYGYMADGDYYVFMDCDSIYQGSFLVKGDEVLYADVTDGDVDRDYFNVHLLLVKER